MIIYEKTNEGRIFSYEYEINKLQLENLLIDYLNKESIVKHYDYYSTKDDSSRLKELPWQNRNIIVEKPNRRKRKTRKETDDYYHISYDMYIPNRMAYLIILLIENKILFRSHNLINILYELKENDGKCFYELDYFVRNVFRHSEENELKYSTKNRIKLYIMDILKGDVIKDFNEDLTEREYEYLVKMLESVKITKVKELDREVIDKIQEFFDIPFEEVFNYIDKWIPKHVSEDFYENVPRRVLRTFKGSYRRIK